MSLMRSDGNNPCVLSRVQANVCVTTINNAMIAIGMIGVFGMIGSFLFKAM